MTEVIPDAYDIAHPTPVSLKQLSAIAISLEIWRREVNKYRKSRTLESFEPYDLRTRIPLKAILPDLPSAIYDIIYKYVRRFGLSVYYWVNDHYERIFGSDYSHRMEVLKDFDDFVCDYDGDIHYVRTAERMVRCDGLDNAVKFNIACTYFLEDDIKRIWPFVSKSIDIDSVDFDESPHVYYWICRLTNKLDKIIPTRGNVTIDEEMFDWPSRYEWYLSHMMPSLEYFWNGVSRENQMRKVSDLYDNVYVKTFIKIVLPKLDDQQLDEFVNANHRGRHLMRKLSGPTDESIDEELVLGTWSYIRNIMNEKNFKLLVPEMVINQHTRTSEGKDEVDDRDESYAEFFERRTKYTYLRCEIWKSAPPNLKSSVIRDLLPGTELLGILAIMETLDDFMLNHFNLTFLNVEPLLSILQCASFEERSSFWHNCWHILIGSARGDDLQRVMKLCFVTKEHEMAEFKEIMARSDKVRRFCVELLRAGEYFDYLNELVSFICPEIDDARKFQQLILQTCLFRCPRNRLEPWIVRSAEKLNYFVTSPGNSADSLSADFIKRLIPSPSIIQSRLWSLIRKEQVSVEQLSKFIDVFVSTEDTVLRIKMDMCDSVKQCVNVAARRRNQDITGKPYFTPLLLWCLGSEEEVEKFKLTCAS